MGYWLSAQLDSFADAAGYFSLLADGEPAKPAGGSNPSEFLFTLLPLILMVVVFYMMFIRGDLKKQRDQRQMLTDLKKNDAVVTVGGVCGTIVNIAPDSRYVTIRIDDATNTRMRILRSAIASVDAGEESGEKKEEK